MHSLVLGPGALGLLFAARLTSLGEVTLIGRTHAGSRAPGTFNGEIQWQGGRSEPLTLPRIGPAAPLPAQISLLLVSTKAPDTLSALKPVLPSLPRDVPLLLCQNGMGSQQTVAEAFPGRPILAATTTEGAYRLPPGRIVHAGQGETWLGPLTDSAGPWACWLAEQLQRAGFSAFHCGDIEARLWQKLAVNAGINPFTALLDVPNGHLPQSPFFQQRIRPLCREICAVAREEKIELVPDALEERILRVCRDTAENISSMLQDVRAGRTTEIDFINGFIVRRGQTLGIDTPVNQALAQGVKDLSG